MGNEEKRRAAKMAKRLELQKSRLAQMSDEDLVRWDALLEAGVSEVDAMATLCPYPQVITEDEADARFKTKSKLKSKGNYGCHVLVVRPTDLGSQNWMCDEEFAALGDHSAYDIGTVIVDGDVTLLAEANITDRLMCLVVTGSFSAPELLVHETEVSIYGDLRVELLTDHDDLVSVLGQYNVENVATYES